ncbi:unnamed protein product [Ceratitis capitata]|uniref:(Mediterranean fruit fly) hypothetical protein n=1 Tax=Ceratitis capitata TaxID=7213 RepID=A0A811VL46_CERCA|nr:unnamed protein product [Ceratitis capitata]
MPHNNDSNGNSRKLPQSNACRNRTLRCKALYEYNVATNICVYMHPNKCIAVRNTQTLPLHCIFYHQHHLQQQQRHFAATTQSCIIPPSTAKHRAMLYYAFLHFNDAISTLVRGMWHVPQLTLQQMPVS